MRHFEAWGLPLTHPFDVTFSPFESHLGRWQGQSLESRSVDGKVNLGFTAAEFSGAWAAYPAYQDRASVWYWLLPYRRDQQSSRRSFAIVSSAIFSQMFATSKVKPERK